MEKVYSNHFYEPIRRQIATDVVQKELRKLLQGIPENAWATIDKNIGDWFDNSKFELARVHDFWNGFEGISQGFKLKNLLPFLTAENITWQTEEVSVKDIVFMSELPVYEKLLQVPFRGEKLVEYLTEPENKHKLEFFQKDSDLHSNNSSPRDHYPVILLKDSQGYRLLDGHRRTFKAISYQQPSINAYIGEYTTSEEAPKNYWITTGFLRNLVRVADLHFQDEGVVSGAIALLKKLYNEHENVRVVFEKRIIKSLNYSKEMRERLAQEFAVKNY